MSHLQRHAALAALAILVAGAAGCAGGKSGSGAALGPGFYQVQRGDTLSGIARKNGQSVADLARLNRLADPNAIQVGQVLRVAPAGGVTRTTSGTTATSTATGAALASAANATPPATAPASAKTTPRNKGAAKDVTPPAGAITLIWPASGAIVQGYDGTKNKGIDIAGSAGTPVLAAAAGSVAYAGSGLRGYGNLLILKHTGDFLTVYAHNRKLLVKEGQAVRSGQPVAEMGDAQADRVMLHFELRYHGKTTDPMRYLPKR